MLRGRDAAVDAGGRRCSGEGAGDTEPWNAVTSGCGGLSVSGSHRGIQELDLAAVFTEGEDSSAALALVTSLDLSHNDLVQLQALFPLHSLQSLNARFNRIAYLRQLPLRLMYVDLSHNQLQSVEALAYLPCLREVNVSFNRLTTLTGFLTTQPLRVIHAQHNTITSTVGLDGLVQLRLLLLDHNRIARADDLAFLSSACSLESLSLRGNPVTQINGYRQYVTQLQSALLTLDGAPVNRGNGSGPHAATWVCPAPIPGIRSSSSSSSTGDAALSNSTTRELSEYERLLQRHIMTRPTGAKAVVAKRSSGNSGEALCAPVQAVQRDDEVLHASVPATPSLPTTPPRACRRTEKSESLYDAPRRRRESASASRPLPSKAKASTTGQPSHEPSTAMISNGDYGGASPPMAELPKPAHGGEVIVGRSTSAPLGRGEGDARVALQQERQLSRHLQQENKQLEHQLRETRRVVGGLLRDLAGERERRCEAEKEVAVLREALERHRLHSNNNNARHSRELARVTELHAGATTALQVELADLRRQLKGVRERRGDASFASGCAVLTPTPAHSGLEAPAVRLTGTPTRQLGEGDNQRVTKVAQDSDTRAQEVYFDESDGIGWISRIGSSTRGVGTALLPGPASAARRRLTGTRGVARPLTSLRASLPAKQHIAAECARGVCDPGASGHGESGSVPWGVEAMEPAATANISPPRDSRRGTCQGAANQTVAVGNDAVDGGNEDGNIEDLSDVARGGDTCEATHVLATQLKQWLYAEVDRDRRVSEESAMLEQLQQSLAEDELALERVRRVREEIARGRGSAPQHAHPAPRRMTQEWRPAASSPPRAFRDATPPVSPTVRAHPPSTRPSLAPETHLPRETVATSPAPAHRSPGRR